MSFPIITHLDDLRPALATRPEIRLSTNEDGFHIACYMISTPTTFSGEHSDLARECRGITFYPNGEIASRCLHKFFNIGELPETQISALPFGSLKRVMDKRDGSMVHPVLVNGKIILKTKKAFYSDVAILATKLLHSPECKKILAYCADAVHAKQTPIFEFTSPSARIVLPYAQDELKLLHIRDNITGEYAGPDIIKFIGADYGIPTVDEYDPANVSKDSILNSMEFDQNKEGYVIEFESGQMVKGKTQWYLALHRTIVFVRERDIAEMVVNETIDDYKSVLALSGESLDVVNDIEQRVLDEVRKIEIAADEAYALIKDCPDRKTAAMSIKGHPWFSAAMSLFNGKEYDVKEHFMKYVLKEKFSLEQV